jgi:hypothetical protein
VFFADQVCKTWQLEADRRNLTASWGSQAAALEHQKLSAKTSAPHSPEKSSAGDNGRERQIAELMQSFNQIAGVKSGVLGYFLVDQLSKLQPWLSPGTSEVDRLGVAVAMLKEIGRKTGVEVPDESIDRVEANVRRSAVMMRLFLPQVERTPS